MMQTGEVVDGSKKKKKWKLPARAAEGVFGAQPGERPSEVKIGMEEEGNKKRKRNKNRAGTARSTHLDILGLLPASPFAQLLTPVSG